MTRRRKIAVGIWLAATIAFAITAPTGFASKHTSFNHFALMAEAWLHGRLDLGGPPPDYTQGNDFAVLGEPGGAEQTYYVSFPPFPAVVLVPFVAIAGSAEKVPDGLVFILLAGVGPAVLFLALERLRDLGRSFRDERDGIGLARCVRRHLHGGVGPQARLRRGLFRQGHGRCSARPHE